MSTKVREMSRANTVQADGVHLHYQHTHTHICICIYMYIYTYTHICICILYVYVYIYIHTHICIPLRQCLSFVHILSFVLLNKKILILTI